MITKCPNCQMTFADNAMMRHNCREKEDLIEKIADFMHLQWNFWMKYLYSRLEYNWHPNIPATTEFPMKITAKDYYRWQHQMNTPYAELTEKEKDSDREWAIKLIELLDL